MLDSVPKIKSLYDIGSTPLDQRVVLVEIRNLSAMESEFVFHGNVSGKFSVYVQISYDGKLHFTSQDLLPNDKRNPNLIDVPLVWDGGVLAVWRETELC